MDGTYDVQNTRQNVLALYIPTYSRTAAYCSRWT